MKFKLTISKSIVIDTEELTKGDLEFTVGAAWKEQILELLRADTPDEQIHTADPDELLGAIVQIIDEDVEATVDDFEISGTDIQIEILPEDPK